MLPRNFQDPSPVQAQDFVVPGRDSFLRSLRTDRAELASIRSVCEKDGIDEALNAYIAYFRHKPLTAPALRDHLRRRNLEGMPRDPDYKNPCSDRYLRGQLHDGRLNCDFTEERLDWRTPEAHLLTRFPIFHDLLLSAHHHPDDPRYARFIVQHSRDYMKAWPIEEFAGKNILSEHGDSTRQGPWHWGVVHDRLRCWSQVVQQLRHSPHVTDMELVELLHRMLEETRFLMTQVQRQVDLKHNSGGTMLLSLASIAAVLEDFTEAAAWRARIVQLTAQFLDTAFYPDGFFKELTVGYSSELAMEMQVLAWAFQDEPAVIARRDCLKEIVTAMMAISAPNGMLPLYGDSWTVLLARWLFPPLLDWLDIPWMNRFIEKEAPAPPFVVWPVQGQAAWCGYYTMRNDWSATANFLMIDGGCWGLSHMHCDRLSFSLAALGQDFITDPANSAYASDEPNARISMLEAGFLHNTITVDGVDVFIRSPPVWETTEPLRNLWESGQDFTIFAGSFDFAPLKPVRWERRVLFVGGEYWLLQDVLSGDLESAAIEQNFQFEEKIRIDFSGRTTTATAPDGTRLVMLPLESTLEPVLSVGDTTPHPTHSTVWYVNLEKHLFKLGRGWIGGKGPGVIPAPAVTYSGRVKLPVMLTSALIPFPARAAATTLPKITFQNRDGTVVWNLPHRRGTLVLETTLTTCRVIEPV